MIPDQTNISNAYVSGLKEDFSLNGNELNYFNVCYYTAYVVFQVPGLLLMSRPSLARWLLPGLEVLWGICTFAQSRVTNVNQLYALRVLVGMLEAPVFAGTHFILGTYTYNSDLKLVGIQLTTCWQVLGTPGQSCSSEPEHGLFATHWVR